MTIQPKPPILVIDDDPTFNAILVRTLKRRGFDALGADSIESAEPLIETLHPQQVILDLNLAGNSGLNLIPQLLAANEECRIVILTGYGSIATAVEAIKRGATQYFTKPIDLEAILTAFVDTPPPADAPPPDAPLSVERLEWEHIQRVLSEHEGNISATARALKMHRRTLQRKLLKHPVRQ